MSRPTPIASRPWPNSLAGSGVWFVVALFLGALLLALQAPALALTGPEAPAIECADSESVRAGGFIWSDGRPEPRPEASVGR